MFNKEFNDRIEHIEKVLNIGTFYYEEKQNNISKLRSRIIDLEDQVLYLRKQNESLMEFLDIERYTPDCTPRLRYKEKE